VISGAAISRPVDFVRFACAPQAFLARADTRFMREMMAVVLMLKMLGTMRGFGGHARN
jgi:hypothetical protein